ncbi:M90 family metallopeptidase [Parachitinimonas caeni]|uniref:Zinc-dependent peptidase n=1 Tax=Parachitinimonas caeni TaxID=3031301 RepID=A0ABT7DUN0_9NEIS|nr:M90 family metallopeptidase [Parachitinimonas caeni]MDK2122798.1 zinc-dependent peptidase [Parachitinimonas caeni]
MFDFLKRAFSPKHEAMSAELLAAGGWPRLAETLPLLQGLTEDERGALEYRMRRFLLEKSFYGAHDFELTPAMLTNIAAQACLPILALDVDSYKDWLGVIIYPSPFIARDIWRDDVGLVHEGERQIIGMARQDGPLLLSWPDVTKAPALDGWNVVIHECAHKLDMMNGSANGFPLLHKGMNRETWSRVFNRGFEDFRRKLRLGIPTRIDPYAAQDPAEFFAVLSECFFELPHQLYEEYPRIYEQLSLFYKQDPRLRIAKPLVQEFRPEDIPPGSNLYHTNP